MPKACLLLVPLVFALPSCGGEDKEGEEAKIDDPTPNLDLFHIGADARPYAGPGPMKVEFFAKPFNAHGDVSYRWRFDDGTKSTEQNPTHTFTKASTYQVIVDAKDETEISRVNLVLGVWPPKVWKRGVQGLSRNQILKIQRAQARRTSERKRELRQRQRALRAAASEPD
jgi:PKD domain-containing protein